MRSISRLNDQVLDEKDLPYTLFCVLSSAILLFFIPVVLWSPVKDNLSATIYFTAIVLLLLGISLFHNHWHFISVIIITFINGFIIFWTAYRFGRATGVMFFYFPFMLIYLYIFLYNPGTLTKVIKVSLILASLILTISFTDVKAPLLLPVPDYMIQLVYNSNLVLSIIVFLLILLSLYRHFVKLHNRLMEEQQSQHLSELREIDLQHEKEEYSLLLSLRDDIAQTLVTSRMFLQMIQGKSDLLQKADDGVKKAIDGLNNISFELTPSMLIDLGFENGISIYAEQLSNRYKIPVEITLGDRSHTLPEIDRLSIFRIIRQCIEIMVTEGNVSKLNILIQCKRNVEIVFRHNSQVKNFAQLFVQPHRKDLSKRLDYYNEKTTEREGEITMLLDLQCVALS